MDPEARTMTPAAITRRPWPRLVLVSGLLLPLTCFLAGCMGFGNSRNPTPPANVQLNSEMPTAQDLVGYLNRTAAKVTALESRDVDLDIKAGSQSIGVRGVLFCQKPKNFRLKAKIVGRDVADFGSNDQEFWYWIKDDQPPGLYHCSYTDLARGAPLPFPIHPDWVLEALGLAAPAPVGSPEQEQALGRSLQVRKSPDNKYVELIEQTRSAQGQPVTKVTTLNNFRASGKIPQVVGYQLWDARNQLICRATVLSVQSDQASGAVVPHKVELKWPAQQLTMTMTLNEIAVNNSGLAQNTRLFVRPQMRDVRDIDLARGLPLMTPTGIQRAGAFR
jgi:hypothetical protein